MPNKDEGSKQAGAGSGGGQPVNPGTGQQPAAHKPGDPVHEVPLGIPETQEQMKRRKENATRPNPPRSTDPAAQTDQPRQDESQTDTQYDPPEDK